MPIHGYDRVLIVVLRGAVNAIISFTIYRHTYTYVCMYVWIPLARIFASTSRVNGWMDDDGVKTTQNWKFPSFSGSDSLAAACWLVVVGALICGICAGQFIGARWHFCCTKSARSHTRAAHADGPPKEWGFNCLSFVWKKLAEFT